jgi:hypothetical protein
METWNREELYKEIWEQPMLKIAPKYGISGVMLGKVCRKLQIPVPGRGYWARKESGKTVSRKPLSAAKNLPAVHRAKLPVTDSSPPEKPAPEPCDPEYRFLHAQMKLVQLSPQSIESLMNRTGSLPLSLVDLLNEIPMNWREQALNLPTKSA